MQTQGNSEQTQRSLRAHSEHPGLPSYIESTLLHCRQIVHVWQIVCASLCTAEAAAACSRQGVNKAKAEADLARCTNVPLD